MPGTLFVRAQSYLDRARCKLGPNHGPYYLGGNVGLDAVHECRGTMIMGAVVLSRRRVYLPGPFILDRVRLPVNLKGGPSAPDNTGVR